MKKLLLISFCCCTILPIFSQPLFTYGNNEVSKEEFIRAFNKNVTHIENKDKSLRDYLELYSMFKLKVKAAKELKLDTLAQLKFDMMNFRKRLEDGYMVDAKEAIAKTNYKRNAVIKDQELFRYADSVTLLKENRKYPIAKETVFWLGNAPVKMSDWLAFVKAYKLNMDAYKGENNNEVWEKFVSVTAMDYYRKHLEEYNADFKYQMQEFKEANLMYEVMGKKVLNKAGDLNALKAYYESNKDHFLWEESADVILVTAKSYAYADYASENMKKGMSWKNIVDGSEGQIQGDSSRYELAQLPVKPGAKLIEGTITDIVKSEVDNGAGFVKVIRIYPAKLQRTFDEAKDLVITEYQKYLEQIWTAELVKQYPVKVNTVVFQSLLK